MGLQFHETGYGKRFFDVQLPSLIKAVERLADANGKQQAAEPAVDTTANNPVCYPFKQTAHWLLTEQAGEQRDQRGTHQRNAAASHKLFHALGFY